MDIVRRWRERPRRSVWELDRRVWLASHLLLCYAGFVVGAQFLTEAATRDGLAPSLRALGVGLGALAFGCAMTAFGVLYVLRPRRDEAPPPTAGELRATGLQPRVDAARETAERRAWRTRGSA